MEEEKITKINPEETEAKQDKKKKDPKKVAAGKALARKNAEARNFKLEKDEETSSQVDSLDISTIYNGIQLTAGLVGAGFTLYQGWKFFYPEKVSEGWTSPPVIDESSTPTKSSHKSPDF